MKATITVQIPSAPKYLTLIRDLNRHIAAEAGFTDDDAMKITLAIDEAGTNIIRHSYAGKHDEMIEISYWLLKDQLKIRMIDYGAAMDPTTIKPRDLADVRPGGMGVSLIMSIMDRVDYKRIDAKANSITMVKFRP